MGSLHSACARPTGLANDLRSAPVARSERMVSPPDDLGGLRADAVQGLERSRLSSDRGGLELSHLSEAVGTP